MVCQSESMNDVQIVIDIYAIIVLMIGCGLGSGTALCWLWRNQLHAVPIYHDIEAPDIKGA